MAPFRDHRIVHRDSLKLMEGEQYFLVLLHEIGHFYSRSRLPPDSFGRFVREAIR
jgi:hypothetical protein